MSTLGPAIKSSSPIDPLADPLLREFLGYVAVNADRLEANGCMPVAVALRADLWPTMAEVYGYPVVRLAASSYQTWGVLA